MRFLAVLELFKQGLVDLDQTEHFGDIKIEWTGGDPPTPPWPSPSTPTMAEMSESELEFRRAIEAVVLVAHDPVPPDVLAQLVERPVADIENWRAGVNWPSPTVAKVVGSSWCASPAATATRRSPDLVPYVERFLLHDQRARLSGAALETLARVRYFSDGAILGTKAFVETVFQARRAWFSPGRKTAARPLRGLDRGDPLRSARALKVRPLG